MRKKIREQTKLRVKMLLDKKHGKKNLEKLKRARYMRDEYLLGKKRLNLTFNSSDFVKVEKEAEITGLTPTAFLRNSVLAYMKNTRLPCQLAESNFSEMVFLLRNMGNNLNQIARQANTIQRLSFGDFVQTKSVLKNLEDTVADFMKGV